MTDEHASTQLKHALGTAAYPETINERIARTPRRHRRSKAAGDPGLSGDQGPARIRFDPAGTDLALGQARLSHSRRHSDHAAGRGAEDRVKDDRFLPVIASEAKQSIARHNG